MPATAQIAAEDRHQELKERFVGSSLRDAPVPSAVLDLCKVKANCERMLEAVDTLGFGWRAHIKTHKVDFSKLASFPICLLTIEDHRAH